MKQVLQNMKNGDTTLVNVPAKRCGDSQVEIDTRATLISAGTERMLVEFGRANLVNKARQQPEKVRMVLDKVRTDGVLSTLESVQSKLDQPVPLGYCNAGVVRQVGAEVSQFKAGDRVVSNGQHAEVVCVPQTLVAKIPESVPDEHAVFAPLAAIALQGIRLTDTSFGGVVVVSGLGLIGLLAVQLLRAQGCRVLGIDFDRRRLDLARDLGIETFELGEGRDPIEAGLAFSRRRGVDAVLITAATKSSEPVRQAAQMCRKRGRVVLVGTTGLELNRSDFYEKELSFQVSCSYGPGRYDPGYEQEGNDYPIGFVRWTAQRNFEAVLDAMASNNLRVDSLITHRFELEAVPLAYETLATDRSALGMVLKYAHGDRTDPPSRVVDLTQSLRTFNAREPVVGLLGAGNYASRMLIPALRKSGAQLHTIVSSGGVNAAFHGEKNGFQIASTNAQDVVSSSEVNTVVIATRHNSHARFVVDGLNNGKNVFVEKPLAISHDELGQIERAYRGPAASNCLLTVGFNRRFAPLTVEMKRLLDRCDQPKCCIVTVNAGAIPADSWIQDGNVGGGRIVGEACHFVDLLRFLIGSPIVATNAVCISSARTEIADDKASIQLTFADGSHGTIHYFANGGKKFPKERIEVFAGDAVLQNQNFRKLQGYGWPGFRTKKLLRQDKGHVACMDAFLASVRGGGEPPIPFKELMEVSRVTLEAAEMLRR